jgi:Lhr-like helicases
MVFELLDKRIQEGLKELGFNEPTEPQKEAIPYILKGHNLLLISPTGTGKTEAALLPILSLIVKNKNKGIKLLYITPLRALNRDLLDRISYWCSKLDLRISVRHSDTLISERRKQAFMPPDILITTPETLQILLVSKIMRERLKNVKYVIVDEVHELAEDKRGSQLALGLERLRLICKDFQIIGLSATVGDPEKIANFLVGKDRECKIVNIPVNKAIKIKLFYPKVIQEDFLVAEKLLSYPEVISRIRKIAELVKNKKAFLIFTNTRSEAEILGSRLRLIGLEVLVHHSSLSKESRILSESMLKSGEIKGLVCTSSLELGIDIGRIDFVIQYNSPRQSTRLVQRIGRSGHFIKGISEGAIIATNIFTFFESYVLINNALKGKYEDVKIPYKPYDVLLHQIVGLLIEYKKLKIEEIVNIISKAFPFKDLNYEDIEKVLKLAEFLRLISRKGDELFLRSEAFKYYFDNLSLIPEEAKYIVIDKENEMFIGELDESFIAEHGETGLKFILKGEIWEILSIDENERKVYCKRSDDLFGAIPSWIGEEIPVTKETSIETIKTINEFKKGLNLDKEILGEVSDEIHLLKNEEILPNENLIIIENDKNIIIINICYGSKINRFLSKVISYILKEYNKSFRIYNDPYHIIIISKDVKIDELLNILINLPYFNIEEKINEIFDEKDNSVKYRFLHVAKRFGVIKKGIHIGKKFLEELIKQYKNTVVFEEVIKEILFKDIDIEGFKELTKKIALNEIKIITRNKISKLNYEIIRYLLYEFSFKDKNKTIIEIYKTKLLNKIITLICLNCYEYIEEKLAKNIRDLKCEICGSNRIAFSKLPSYKVSKIINMILENRKSRKINKIKRNGREFLN